MNHRTPGDTVPFRSLTWVLCVFTCTFFFYRDFGHRMIYGYILLGLMLLVHLLDLLRRDTPPRADCVCLAA